MVLTEAQLQEIAKRVRAIIRAESKGVGDLPVATSLDGLLSLPALRFNGGVPEVVEAPISKLQDVALDAVSGATKAANEAAVKANTSAGNADKATTAANNAAKSANDAAGTAGAATEAAKKATDAANGAASNATNAATKASSAADTANKEASSVNAAKSEALAAAARASSTATTAEAEIEKMKQLQESISGAASLAPTRMELTYTKRITQRNPYVQRIVAKMFPSYSLQNVLFLGDDVAVSVDPAGVVTPLKNGTSRIHVIPTQATHLYKTINVTVQDPSVRLTGGGKIRVDSKGRIRLT
ncbi:hypothetical protein Odosp_0794 [Odoribacter splanchnicus DSM 20712]|jgi:hypothetical protein|uniref:Uncharacterized protein n=1 Tax=Odoribacter splanchnicus (strain ATCC 29572 / DSM 20712 / CIP 104287 / JCM 15291 / NCTC 10825 / 1651/6) TaxID=709991 RepID=F9Z8F5_ODOSD|nr:hypothetical protein [Odoribacter splanchnicus]ADY31871.1 hypothetical protein Odosp_0794 [Odoribacter splanchnicus DSM 20712]UEB86993.1 hypothetical protein LK432_17760 [Odoribacter splanchnicus DSM 20712]SNV28889.1 Uncharacterised protein [Odoribacter splanchnicus]